MKLGCLSEKIIIDGQYLSSHQLCTILRLLTMFKHTPIYHHSVSILHLFFVSMLIGTFNDEKVLFWAFSGHCETSRRFVDSSTGQCAAQHTAVPVQAAGTRSRGRARCRNNVNTSAVILKVREVLYCIYRFKIYIRIFIPVHSSGPDIETSARQPVSQNVSCPVQLLYDSSFSSFHSLWVGTLHGRAP